MKGVDNLIRLQKWKVDEKRRELAELEGMRLQLVARLDQITAELEHEKQVVRDLDLAPYYGPFANAVRIRQQTINESIAQVESGQAKMRDELSALFQEQKRFEIAKERREELEEREAARREQSSIDNMTGRQHHRRKMAQG